MRGNKLWGRQSLLSAGRRGFWSPASAAERREQDCLHYSWIRLVFLFVLVGSASTAEGPTQWTPELSMQVRNITDVLPSFDGRLVVWTESSAGMAPENSE